CMVNSTYNRTITRADQLAHRRIVHRNRLSPTGRPALRFVFSLFLALSLLLTSVAAAAQTPTTSSSYDANELLAIKPELRESVAASLPEGMTEYEIEIVVPDTNPSSGVQIDGSQRVHVTNTTGEPLTELPF